MNRRHVRAVLAREWLDLSKSRAAKITAWLLPLGLIAAVAGTEVWLSSLDPKTLASAAEEIGRTPSLGIGGAGEAPLVTLLNFVNLQWLALILIQPAVLPQMISVYSIVTEKESRSLEAVLATPISTLDLLLGKTLVAVLPAIALTWLCYLGSAAASAFAAPASVALHFFTPRFALAFSVLVPLVAFLAGISGVIVSAHARDVRGAQSLSGFVVLPLMGVALVPLVNSLSLLAVTCALLTLVSLWLSRVAVRLFRRGEILTRWR